MVVRAITEAAVLARAVLARIHLVDRAAVRAPMKVTRRARCLVIASNLHVPEERLPQLNRGRFVLHETSEIGGLGNGDCLKPPRRIGRRYGRRWVGISK